MCLVSHTWQADLIVTLAVRDTRQWADRCTERGGWLGWPLFPAIPWAPGKLRQAYAQRL